MMAFKIEYIRFSIKFNFHMPSLMSESCWKFPLKYFTFVEIFTEIKIYNYINIYVLVYSWMQHHFWHLLKRSHCSNKITFHPRYVQNLTTYQIFNKIQNSFSLSLNNSLWKFNKVEKCALFIVNTFFYMR